MAVAEAAHNSILLNAVLPIRSLMRQWIERTVRVPRIPVTALGQHKNIYTAISKTDAEGARSAMEDHLTEMGKVLLATREPDFVVATSGG